MINRLLLLLALSFFSIQVAYAWTVELTEDELQQKINKRVPIEKKKLLFTVIVSAIDVELKEGSELIGMIADMEIRSPHLSTGKGKAWLEGKLNYKAAEGAFYLQQATVKDVKFANIPDKYHAVVRKIFQRAIQKRLANTPVYKLDKNRVKHQFAKSLLKSVKVVNRKLVLELGLM